jgi:hypothetical protein
LLKQGAQGRQREFRGTLLICQFFDALSILSVQIGAGHYHLLTGALPTACVGSAPLTARTILALDDILNIEIDVLITIM